MNGLVVYVAMIADRHRDPEPYLFATPDEAIDFARTWAQDLAHGPEAVEEHPPPEGWLYSADYSAEGDSVWVLPKTIGEQ